MTDIDELLATVPIQVKAYTEISVLARDGKYPEALKMIKTSPLNESTKQHLTKVIEDGDPFIVDRILGDIDMRIAQAMCWDCWRE